MRLAAERPRHSCLTPCNWDSVTLVEKELNCVARCTHGSQNPCLSYPLPLLRHQKSPFSVNQFYIMNVFHFIHFSQNVKIVTNFTSGAAISLVNLPYKCTRTRYETSHSCMMPHYNINISLCQYFHKVNF